MINKILKFTLCCLLSAILLFWGLPASAAENASPKDVAQDHVDGILSYKMNAAGADNIQQWINGELTQNAGTSEWYVIALSGYGEYDFSSYGAALSKYLAETKVSSASSRQKYALALIASGSTNTYISNTLNDSIGKQGVMSWIFGLHLLNNGYKSNEYSLEEVKEQLLNLQLSDGGWAVMGNSSETDATAMAIQALSPHYNTDSEVKVAVDSALALLSDRQLQTGDYASYGIGNTESTAQVLVALTSLNIDPMTDSRFIKNGNTIFDGIGLYKLSDGSFCHKTGGGTSGTATIQALYSFVSYLRMANGRSGLYVFDTKSPLGEVTESTPASETADTAAEQILTSNETESDNSTAAEKSGGYKLWVCLALAAVAGMLCLMLFHKGKRNIQNFIVIIVLTAAAVAFVLLTDFSSTEAHYGSADSSVENNAETVTITIRCDSIPDKSAEHIPDDGIVLDTTEISFKDGDTVYDILLKATAENKIHLETTGGGDSAYVQGISNIYEFNFGDLSGWMYHVNGKSPSVGCGEYKVSAGDKIEFLYTCNLGKDLE